MDVRLAHLSLLHFRNHREARLDLGPQVNCLVGPNGVGKTNLLDAVHYLSLCKSYFDPSDQHAVLHGEDLFLVKGRMRGPDGEDELLCSVRKGSRKVFSRNRKEYERLADHVGRYPVVMITPYDAQLVLDGSDVRRRFLDGLIAQFDRAYLEALVRYNRALAQRNLLLRQHGWRLDRTLVEPWDEQLVQQGEAVFAVRTAFMEELVPLLAEHYRGISSGPEEVALSYRSTLAERTLREQLDEAWDKDRQAGHTTVGVHRDDLLFSLDGRLEAFWLTGPAEDLPHRAEAGSVRPDGQAQWKQARPAVGRHLRQDRPPAHAPPAAPAQRPPLRSGADHRYGCRQAACGARRLGPGRALLPCFPRRPHHS